MPADFSAIAKTARAQITVPTVDVSAIRERSRQSGLRERVRSLVISGALVFGALGTAVAFAANAGGVRVWMFGSKSAITIDSFAMTFNPTMADLRKITQSAAFRVVLPTGVPAGSRIAWIAYSPADRPDFFTISYVNRSSKLNVGVNIVQSSAIERDAALLPSGTRVTESPHHWTVGSETVIAGKPADVVRRIEEAMASATPASSLQANAPWLSRVTVLPRCGCMNFAELANRYAPAEGNSVLLGTDVLRAIPKLAHEGKALPDTRTVYMTDIPTLHGQPDYVKATLHWPQATAISPDGVRAIAAAVQATGTTAKCGCVVLFHQPSATAYWVWKIGIAASHGVEKYAVDAKTLKVTAMKR